MSQEPVSCHLCGLTTHFPLADEAGNQFCCPACREVASLLAESPPSPAAMPAPSTAVAQKTVELSLGGLWCPSCSWLIGERLRRDTAVSDADVNFLQRTARITYDPQRTEPSKLVRRVHRLGYRAWLPEQTPGDEEESYWLRLIVSGMLTMHIMLISFMLYWREWTGRAGPETVWLENWFALMLLIMCLPVLLILGVPILRAGSASLLRGRPNIHTLVGLGATAAFLLSVRNFVNGQGAVYFDTTAVLLFLVALGRWLEMQAQKTSGEAVERLWAQLPPTAVQLTPEGEEEIPADAIRAGMQLRVRPGGRFAADGLVAEGRGDVDESLLTGEPEPVLRQQGDRVLAGSLNLDGAFDIVVTAVGDGTIAGQIGRLLHQAMWQRAPVERLADRLAAWLTPIAIGLAGLAFAYWTRQAGIETGLVVALSVLLIACPCALGIATPLTLWIGLERAAGHGIILRQTAVLERLAHCRHVFFDKTGTLTERPIRLHHVLTLPDITEAEFMDRVTAVEQLSEHPLGQAICGSRSSRLKAAQFQALPGFGAMAVVQETAVWVGNRSLMAQQALKLPPTLATVAEDWQAAGYSFVYGGWQGQVQGLLVLGETAHPEAAAAIRQLKVQGLSITVLTGDSAAAGQRWQQNLGVPVLAELRPEQKVARLSRAGEGSLMVGDGINDSPALAAATVGIAVHHGADVTQSAADAVLLQDDLSRIPWLLDLSRLTLHKVRQNLAWAVAYNLIGLTFALSGHLHPALAALLMVGSNLVVTTNALRLRRAAITPPGAAGQTAVYPSHPSLTEIPPSVTIEHG